VSKIRTKHLAMRLSGLPRISDNSSHLEQYQTEGDLAARWLTDINSDNSLVGARVVDLGAGNGILAMGALLLGASHATLIEVDSEAVKISEAHGREIAVETNSTIEVIEAELKGWPDGLEADMVIMNPPWGFQSKGADRIFIEAALASPADTIHLMHSAQATHPPEMAEQAGWDVEKRFSAEFRLPASMAHHTNRTTSTRATFWSFKRRD
jgi:predicted RNA methylase